MQAAFLAGDVARCRCERMFGESVVKCCFPRWQYARCIRRWSSSPPQARRFELLLVENTSRTAVWDIQHDPVNPTMTGIYTPTFAVAWVHIHNPRIVKSSRMCSIPCSQAIADLARKPFCITNHGHVSCCYGKQSGVGVLSIACVVAASTEATLF
jgi:hypothetical protein